MKEKQPLSKIQNFRLTNEDFNKLKEIANKENLKIAHILRKLITNYLALPKVASK